MKSAELTGVSDYKHLHLHLFFYLHWKVSVTRGVITMMTGEKCTACSLKIMCQRVEYPL